VSEVEVMFNDAHPPIQCAASAMDKVDAYDDLTAVDALEGT